MDQRTAAASIGVDRSGYSRLETGKAPLDVRKLHTLLTALVPGGVESILQQEAGRAALIRAMRVDADDGIRILGLALGAKGADPSKLYAFWRRAVHSDAPTADGTVVAGYATVVGKSPS